MIDDATAPVRTTVAVQIEPGEAFDLFTTRIGSWWPLETHSLSETTPVGARFEPVVGGAVYEVLADGTEVKWADVIEWDPPHRFVLSWQVHKLPVATEVEVSFAATGEGTSVTVVHHGWERLGDLAGEIRSGYGSGWELVLGHFVEAA